jgi:hypothetical protein
VTRRGTQYDYTLGIVLLYLDTQISQYIQELKSNWSTTVEVSEYHSVMVRTAFVPPEVFVLVDAYKKAHGSVVYDTLVGQILEQAHVQAGQTPVTGTTLAHILYNRIWTAINIARCTGVRDGDLLAYQSDDMSLLTDTLGRILSATNRSMDYENVILALESFIVTRHKSVKVRFVIADGHVYSVFQNSMNQRTDYFGVLTRFVTRSKRLSTV